MYGEVNETSASQVIAAIQVANQFPTNAPIWLLINSGGGSIIAGDRIVDAMQSSRRPIYTVDVSFAASMSAWIWTFGEKRYMQPRAILMFHDAELGNDGNIQHLTQEVRVFNAVVTAYNARVAMLSGLSMEEIDRREAAEWWLLPQEAITDHLATDIVHLSDYPQNILHEDK